MIRQMELGVAGESGIGTAVESVNLATTPHRCTRLAACFALGIALGNIQQQIWPWLIAAACTVLISAWLYASGRRGAMLVLCLATMCFAAAWLPLRHWHAQQQDIAAWMGESTVLVQLRGVATERPELRRPIGGSLAAFDYRAPSTYFPMRITHVIDDHGEARDVTGRVLVKVKQALPPFRAGDHVEVTGHLMPFFPPANPGEFDIQELARTLGQAGVLTVPDRRLVAVTPAPRHALVNRWLAFHDELRRRASGMLLSSLPAADDIRAQRREALLQALVLGQREPELDQLAESFQRVGLAHLMAISGLHLGIVVGLVLLLVRLGGHTRRWHGWLMIAVVLAYLVLVDVRLPVLRAGVMTMTACLGLALGRRWHVGGLIALSGIALLLWRPDQLFTPGFQLSFGVVFALIYLQPNLRLRWFGQPDTEAGSSAQMLGQWTLTALTTASIAWLIATPIVMYHFGIVAPAGIPLSVIGVPVTAAILALGYLKLMLGLLLPSAALLLGVPLSILTDAAIAFVLGLDSLPGSSWHVPFPSAAWTCTALALVAVWAGRPFAPRLRMAGAALAVLALWLYLPGMFMLRDAALRLDMLSVGDGTCIVLRSDGKTLVYDAGSSSSLDAGRRWIVPAMRRLNIRDIDAVAISHADIDHYAAVLELVDAFDVDRVLVTPQLYRQVAKEPDSAIAHVIDNLTQRRVLIQQFAAGDTMQLGLAQIACLHPAESTETDRRDNELSMVLAIEAASRRVLLTGDLERSGIARLLPRNAALDADVVELPHHGSYNELAAALIEQLQPQVVLQSTGYTRFSRDGWGDALADITRLVTARDGACWVEIAHDGTISTGTFNAPQDESATAAVNSGTISQR